MGKRSPQTLKTAAFDCLCYVSHGTQRAIDKARSTSYQLVALLLHFHNLEQVHLDLNYEVPEPLGLVEQVGVEAGRLLRVVAVQVLRSLDELRTRNK